ncbi:MAG: hypothetical protein HY800_05800 [Ignavibacteriales bacterium]|nr:hypothetical protein [Ignavibacteriales bacterium]
MTVFKYVIICIIIIFVAGCVRSLYPLFTEEDLIFKTELVGTWVEKDGKNTWIFEQSGEKEYTLYHYEAEFEVSSGNKTPGDTAMFFAQLGQLDKYFFLDIYPGKPATKVKNGLYNFHLLPVHTFSRLWIEEDTLQLSMLDNDWLERMIEKNAFKIPHARSNDQLILTASTEELQQLVMKYAENTKAFPNPAVLYRIK